MNISLPISGKGYSFTLPWNNRQLLTASISFLLFLLPLSSFSGGLHVLFSTCWTSIFRMLSTSVSRNRRLFRSPHTWDISSWPSPPVYQPQRLPPGGCFRAFSLRRRCTFIYSWCRGCNVLCLSCCTFYHWLRTGFPWNGGQSVCYRANPTH
mgnify:CR=1 FL=1